MADVPIQGWNPLLKWGESSLSSSSSTATATAHHFCGGQWSSASCPTTFFFLFFSLFGLCEPPLQRRWPPRTHSPTRTGLVLLVTPVDRLPNKNVFSRFHRGEKRFELAFCEVLHICSRITTRKLNYIGLKVHLRAWQGRSGGNYAMIGMYKGNVLVFVRSQCFEHPDFLGRA